METPKEKLIRLIIEADADELQRIIDLLKIEAADRIKSEV